MDFFQGLGYFHAVVYLFFGMYHVGRLIYRGIIAVDIKESRIKVDA